MPIVDLPLKELYQYQGMNPRPADFDEYWDRSIAEMKALDADVTLTPAAFQAPHVLCRDMWFTGMHGARVHCRVAWRRDLTAPAPAVCLFHGYHCATPSFSGMMGLAGAGFVVAALDCRGQCGESEDVGGVKGSTLIGHVTRGLDDPDPERLLFRDVFLDAAQMAGIVMSLPQVDKNRVAARGGSQGGALTLACAALEPRIALAVPDYPFLCDYKRVWDMDLDVAAYNDLRDYFRHYDPTHAREDAIFEKLGYIDIQHLAPRIRAEVFMATGLLDTICPPSTQFAAYNKITAEKHVTIYPDFGHEELLGRDDDVFQILLRL